MASYIDTFNDWKVPITCKPAFAGRPPHHLSRALKVPDMSETKNLLQN